MKEYLIFRYVIDGQDYVEAYPIHYDDNGVPPSKGWGDLLSNNVAPDEFSFVSAPSRNAARRAAYCNWVRNDGVGFNALPYRVHGRATITDGEGVDKAD